MQAHRVRRQLAAESAGGQRLPRVRGQESGDRSQGVRSHGSGSTTGSTGSSGCSGVGRADSPTESCGVPATGVDGCSEVSPVTGSTGSVDWTRGDESAPAVSSGTDGGDWGGGSTGDGADWAMGTIPIRLAVDDKGSDRLGYSNGLGSGRSGWSRTHESNICKIRTG